MVLGAVMAAPLGMDEAQEFHEDNFDEYLHDDDSAAEAEPEASAESAAEQESGSSSGSEEEEEEEEEGPQAAADRVRLALRLADVRAQAALLRLHLERYDALDVIRNDPAFAALDGPDATVLAWLQRWQATRAEARQLRDELAKGASAALLQTYLAAEVHPAPVPV